MANFLLDEKEKKIILKTGGGMFSWCSVKLDNVCHYHNTYKELPKIIDGQNAFGHYKTQETKGKDITSHFFMESNNTFSFSGKSNFHYNCQFAEYKNLDFSIITKFVKHYFNPSKTVNGIINELDQKYNINYEQTICIYYRGTDKSAETKIASQADFLNKLSEIVEKYPMFNIVCLTDEISFETQITNIYHEKLTIFKEVSQSMYSSEKRDLKARSYTHGLYMLACVFMLQKCHTIICGSGNVSLWLALLRGHGNNIHQNLHLKWV